MTKDEALKMCLEYIETDAHERKYVRHAIKDALAQPEQEPVAWAHKESMEAIKNFDATIYANGGFDDAVALYTTPPQRTWVGLTEEDKHSIEIEAAENDFTDLGVILATEAKLKEKNT